MFHAQELYREKSKTIMQALSLIRSGDMIVTSLAGGEPVDILNELHTVTEQGVSNIDISNCLPIGNYPFIVNPDYQDKITLSSWFYGPQVRSAVAKGATNISHVPQHLHSAFSRRNYARLQDNRRLVLLVTCSPMDEHGYLSMSLSCTYEREAVDAGALVIAEVNPNMPRTFGDNTIHISEIAALVETSHAAPTIPIAPFSDKDVQIGNFIAEHVEDGATIQLGIGGIPNALAAALTNKRHLGIHTEMFTDGMVDLIECGAVDNSMKGLNNHKSIATFALGTQRLYDFIGNNPSVELRNGNYTNDPYVLAQNHKMTSINTSLEVDFFGQCASEAIGPVQFSGTGGQADTSIGAQLSPGGKSFIALYATANVKNEAGERIPVSKIVPFLKQGSIVSLSRNDVDYVVTEYGVASLRGRSIVERTKRLIAIAHPDFRDELTFEGKKNGFIY